jgi:hypothetical protein
VSYGLSRDYPKDYFKQAAQEESGSEVVNQLNLSERYAMAQGRDTGSFSFSH